MEANKQKDTYISLAQINTKCRAAKVLHLRIQRSAAGNCKTELSTNTHFELLKDERLEERSVVSMLESKTASLECSLDKKLSNGG